MQQQPPRRANGQASASPSREANIARDESVIEAMLASLARGGLETDAWESLYAEARRTDRLSELALAFEGVAQGKRLRAVQPAIAAEFLFQAGCFVGDVFGDAPSAAAYFERALAIAPTHAGSFAHLERILVNTRQWKRLADLFIGAAHQRPRGEQPALLRGATEALARAGDADNRMVEILGQIVRLDPGDEPSRVRLEAFFVRASRFRDVVALHERALAADPPLSFEARKSSLARVIELYAGQLQEPERALPHVEQLLAIEPAHAGARAVAQKLVVVKGLVGRAAAALATAFESTGPLVEVVRYLSIELETTRGPKRASLLARLGRLKQDGLADNLGAFEAFEQAVSIDADEEVRRRYVALASTLGRHIEASKVLARVVATAKDGASKARATAQLGGLLLGAGDAKRARGLLASVLGAADAPDDAVLAASQLLRDLLEPEKDRAALCDVLERLALLEPDADRRRMADERLSELAVLLGDTPRAVAAYERLLTTSARSTALEALMPHYEQSGDPLKYAQLLEAKARDTADESEARALWMTAARVRATETKDAAAAIATCRTVIGRYMAEKDILAILVPLLEGQGMWHELADALASEVALTTGPDRARVLYRLGSVKLLRLHDRPGAIDAFAAALASDPEEKPARQALEKLASTGDSRLLAARAIERTVRSEGARGPLLRILEVVGSLAPDVDERLAALREAVELASAGSPQEASRVVDLVARALGDASGGRRPIGEWLVHLDRVAPRATDSKRRAAILEAAVAQHEVDTPERSFVAKLAAEALVASGDGPGAVALYRRALAFEPHSSELLARIDDLLRDQGSPAARVALYRAALAGASPARRRELLHRIGGIERHDLHDSAAAVATFRSALDDDPDDADAFAALEELYRQGERWSELAALIEQGLSRSVGLAAQVLRAKLAPLLALHGDRDRAKTHSAILLEDPDLAPDHFDLIARAAELLGDVDMACVVLRRRVASAQELHEQIAWLDRLGEAEQDLRGDLRASADAWKQAAKLAETCGDDESARRLYSRARKVAPDDAEVTARLVALCEKGEIWSELPPLYVALAHHASNDGERVSLALRTAQVLFERIGDSRSAARHASRAFDLAPNRADVLEAFERMTIASRAIDEFEEAVREALRRSTGEEEHRESSRESPAGHQPATAAPTRLALLFAQARVLASDPVRVHDAIGLYRSLLGDSTCLGTDQASALDGLESLLAQEHEPAHRVGDRRWLLEWRAEHASEAQRVERLLDWARQEEAAFSDPDRALAIHRRILTVDPECDEALASVARLALSMGDVEQALGALGVRRGFAEGAARVIIERQAAQILMSRTDRWEDALASLGAVLADAPGDPLARELLAQLLAHPGARARAADLLEHAYEGVDDVDVREDILRTLLSAGADPTEPEVRERRFQRLCDLQCGAGRVEAALVSALQAAREMPEFSSLWGRAEDMARILARPDDLASLYEEVLGSPISSANAVAIGERAVAFFEEWFDDSGRVVPLLTRVLDLAPDAEWAFERLKLLLDGGERWDELFSLYDRVLLSVSGSRREALLEDAAQIAKDFADRPDRATGYFEELRRLRPTDAKLASALERLYDRQGRHRALVFLLESRLPELDAEEAGRLRVRIAGLWLDELCDPANALDVLEPLLARAGAVQMGLAASAWVVLERILDAASPPSAGPAPDRAAPHGFEAAPSPTSIADPAGGSFAEQAPPHATPAPVRYRAAEWLRRHYASTGRDDALARILTIELERVSDRSERVRRLVALAELCEKIGDDESAFEHVGRAVVLAPEDDDIRRRLSEIAEKTNRLGRLADVIADAADAAESEVLRVSLVLGAADIRAGRLADSLGATAILFSVLNEGRLGDDRALLVARRLSPLLRETGRLAEQLDVVERIAGLEKDAAAASEALGYGARLALDLGQISRGIELWERRLRANELDTEALDALAERLEREGRNERLAEILELRATAASDPSLRRADLVRVAALVGSAEDGCDRAISVWRRIEDEFGLGEDTATALAGLFESTGRWPDLAGLLVRSARVAPDRFTRAERWGLLGDVQRGRLNSPEAAVDAYREALAADSGHAVARAGLELLAREPAVRGAAVGALLAVLRERDEWRAILELTEERLHASGGAEESLAILREAAKLAEDRARDPAAAFGWMRRAFALAPARPDLQNEIIRLAEVTGQWRGLVEAYTEAAEPLSPGDEALAVILWATIGVTLEERLGDVRGALDAYLRVVSHVTANPGIAGIAVPDAALAALRVAAREAAWEGAAGVVCDVADKCPETLTAVLDGFEAEAAAWDAWEPLLHALEVVLSAHPLRGPAALELHYRLSVWHRDGRGDLDAAEVALKRALGEDPSRQEILQALALLQRRRPDRDLVETLTALSRARGGDLALLHEAGRVARELLPDVALAQSVAREILTIARERGIEAHEDESPSAPHAEWAIDLLAESYAESGDAQAVVEVLLAGDAMALPLEVRHRMRRQAAVEVLYRLRDEERAITLLLSLFDENPRDIEAVDRLAGIYAAHGRYRDLLRLRERQLAVVASEEERIALQLEAAQLLVALGDAEQAVEMLRVALRESPRHGQVVGALVEILETSGRREELRDLLVDQAELAERQGDRQRAADEWARAARVAELLGDDESAGDYHTRVVAIQPRAASLESLANLALGRGHPAAAALWLERWAAVVEPHRRAEAVLKLADALTAAGEPQRAVECLEASMARYPDCESVCARLGGLYRERGEWDKLAQLVADAAARATDKTARLSRLVEAASLFMERCGRPDCAIPLLELAADLSAGDPMVRLALADALVRASRYGEARALLQTLIDGFGARRPKERAPVHHRMALLELATGNRARALLELDAAARVDPQNREVLAHLAQLARDEGEYDRAEKSYRALLVVLRRRDDDAPPPIARSEVLVELAAIAEGRGEVDRARELVESALEAGGQSPFEQERLEHTLHARGDDATLVRVLEAKLRRQGDACRDGRTLGELADVLALRLGRGEEALSLRLRAIAVDPGLASGHDAALALARSIHQVSRYVHAVTPLSDAAMAAGEVGLCRMLLVRLADVTESDLGEVERAIGLYERALALGDPTPELLRALDRVYERIGDVNNGVRILSMRIRLEGPEVAPPGVAEALYRLAALRLGAPLTLDEGAVVLEQALALSPDYEFSERILKGALAIDPTRIRLLDLYEQVGRRSGREPVLVDALRLRAAIPGAGVDAVREAVEAAFRIGDWTLAEAVLTRFIHAKSEESDGASSTWALASLACLRERAGDWHAAVELKARAARFADPAGARRLRFEVAKIAADEIGDLDLAADAYGAVHQSDPTDREAWEALAGIYRRQGDGARLAALLASVVESVDEPAERARLRLERLRVMQESLHLEDADAVPLLYEILEEDAGADDASIMLSGILERRGAVPELAALLARQLEAAKDRGDASSVISLALRLGKLVEPEDPSDARNLYYVGLDWDSQNRDLLEALWLVLDPKEHFAERAEVLERRLEIDRAAQAGAGVREKELERRD